MIPLPKSNLPKNFSHCHPLRRRPLRPHPQCCHVAALDETHSLQPGQLLKCGLTGRSDMNGSPHDVQLTLPRSPSSIGLSRSHDGHGTLCMANLRIFNQILLRELCLGGASKRCCIVFPNQQPFLNLGESSAPGAGVSRRMDHRKDNYAYRLYQKVDPVQEPFKSAPRTPWRGSRKDSGL